jgi:curved DNA-binding protein CbpA
MGGGSKCWLLGLIGFVLSIGAQQEKHCGPAADDIKYDWEKFDYYEILDLPSAGRKVSRRKRQAARQKSESNDVRRAYRRQAQLHHPDKKNETVSTEESNVRFARIAEAYEVLHDQTKRIDYDRWLLDCEDDLHVASSGSQQSQQGTDSWFDNLRSKDPRQVFEEFFYGSSRAKDDMFGDVLRSTNRPVRVQEHREIVRDIYGNEVVRVFQTEEYPAERDGTFFYRIIGQDYAEQYERFHGWVYQPISRPFVVEEGYRHETIDTRRSTDKQMKNTLHVGEILTQNSPVLSSKNLRYYAGITPDCELVIMSTSSQKGMDGDVLIWSSNTFVPHVYGSSSCFLRLRGPHLVLSVGDRDHPGAILWHSDVSESIVIEEARLKESGYPAPEYFARLDDDGSLAVYTLQPLSTSTAKDRDNGTNGHTIATWLSKFMSKKKSSPRARVGNALHALRKWKQKLLRRPASDSKKREPSHESDHQQEVCIFATGIAGCHAGGRKLFKLACGVGRSVKSMMTKIDSTINSICESFQGDEEDDFLDNVVRIIGQTGNGLGNVCQKIAQSSLKAARNVVENRKAEPMS